MNQKALLTYCLPIALMGSLLIYWATTLGIGLSPDSAVYIGAAQNLWAGNGLQAPNFEGTLSPMTHYPPLLSMLLASMGVMQLSPVTAFRYLHLFIYLSNIALVAYCLFRYSRQNHYLSIWGIAFLSCSVPLLAVYAMAWSEALFLFWLLWSLFFTTKYLEQGAKIIADKLSLRSSRNEVISTSYLVAASLATAAAFLTRYIGITLVGTLVLAILLLNQRTWWHRFKAAFVAGCISCLPMFLWLWHNMEAGGNATNRSLAFHLPTTQHIKQLVGSVTTWLFPLMPDMASPQMRLLWALPVCLLLMVYMFVLIWFANKKAVKSVFSVQHLATFTKHPFIATLGIFLLVYWLFLFTAITLFDASTPLNLRILMPVYLGGVIWILLVGNHYYPLLYASLSPKKKAFLQRLSTLLASIFLLVYIGTALYWTHYAHQQGLGFHHQPWQNSSIIAYLKQLPPQTPIYTNGIRSTYLLTNRAPIRLPMLMEPTSGQDNIHFKEELKQMHTQLMTQKGVLVYFNKYPHLTYLPSESMLLEQLPLTLVQEATDGNVYVAK